MHPDARTRLATWIDAGKRVYGFRLDTEEAPDAVFELCLLIFRLDLRLGRPDPDDAGIARLREEARSLVPHARSFWDGRGDPAFRAALAAFLEATDALPGARAAG